jgi:hypothetical protein
MDCVKRVVISVSAGKTADRAGSSRTSSKVNASRIFMGVPSAYPVAPDYTQSRLILIGEFGKIIGHQNGL